MRKIILITIMAVMSIVLIVAVETLVILDNSKASVGEFSDDCQYPMRPLNEDGTCNNSDPARPECMKYGLEDCDLPLENDKNCR